MYVIASLIQTKNLLVPYCGFCKAAWIDMESYNGFVQNLDLLSFWGFRVRRLVSWWFRYFVANGPSPCHGKPRALEGHHGLLAARYGQS